MNPVELPSKIRRLFGRGEVYTFVSHDREPMTTVVYEPDCPVDQVHAKNGFVLVPHPIARRLPDPQGTITHAQGTVPCWKLDDLSDGPLGN